MGEIMKKIVIATDLDGTLLNDDAELSAYSKEIIDKALKQGITIVPCTARPYKWLPQSLLETDIRYFVTANGAAIYDKVENKVVSSYYINNRTILDIIALVEEYKGTYFVTLDGIGYCEQRFADQLKEIVKDDKVVNDIMSQKKIIEDVVAFTKKHPYFEKFNFNYTDLEDKEKSRQLINKYLGYNCTSSSPSNIEIMAEGINKGKGLLEVCTLLKLEEVEISAFGDNLNDLDLLKVAHKKYAVNNAHADLKQVADIVLEETNDEDAVAKVISTLL